LTQAPTHAKGAERAPRRASDEESGWLARFYAAQRGPLCGYLRRKYGAGPPDPADVTHQAFAKLAQMGEAAVKGLEFPRAFLFRVAENLLIREKRRTRAQTHQSNVIFALVGSEEALDSDPESVLVMREELAVIEETIRSMPERRRRCFLMHRMEELSFAEVGRRLFISATAAANHVERALADIEAALAEQARPKQLR
jgi:RNA polymerase sigma factor (sigma-70 family)